MQLTKADQENLKALGIEMRRPVTTEKLLSAILSTQARLLVIQKEQKAAIRKLK